MHWDAVTGEFLTWVGIVSLGIVGSLIWLVVTGRNSGRTGMWDDEDDWPYSSGGEDEDPTG